MLTVSQFKRFMEVIKKLGDRVEKEHDQYLRDSQRLEDRSTATNGVSAPTLGGGVDFETLVAGGTATVKADTVIDSTQKGWDDDVWGSIFNENEVGLYHLSTISCSYVLLVRGKSHHTCIDCSSTTTRDDIVTIVPNGEFIAPLFTTSTEHAIE